MIDKYRQEYAALLSEKNVGKDAEYQIELTQHINEMKSTVEKLRQQLAFMHITEKEEKTCQLIANSIRLTGQQTTK